MAGGRFRRAGGGEPTWGAWVVITGLIVILVSFVVAVLHYDNATEATTAVGAVSGVIAALVGAYFGVRSTYTAQRLAGAASRANVAPDDIADATGDK